MLFIVCEKKCRLVLVASSTQQKRQQCILAHLPTGNSLGLADGSFQLAMACKFFSGLTNVSQLAMA